MRIHRCMFQLFWWRERPEIANLIFENCYFRLMISRVRAPLQIRPVACWNGKSLYFWNIPHYPRASWSPFQVTGHFVEPCFKWRNWWTHPNFLESKILQNYVKCYTSQFCSSQLFSILFWLKVIYKILIKVLKMAILD